MRFEKVLNGILRYMDSEIYSNMNDWQEIAARIAVSRLVRNSDGIKKMLIDNAFVKTFAIMDDEGDVDVEGLMQDIKEQIESKGKLTISLPMFGTFSFVPADVDNLHRMIMEA